MRNFWSDTVWLCVSCFDCCMRQPQSRCWEASKYGQYNTLLSRRGSLLPITFSKTWQPSPVSSRRKSSSAWTRLSTEHVNMDNQHSPTKGSYHVIQTIKRCLSTQQMDGSHGSRGLVLAVGAFRSTTMHAIPRINLMAWVRFNDIFSGSTHLLQLQLWPLGRVLGPEVILALTTKRRPS